MNEIMTSVRRAPYQSLAAFLVLFFTLLLSGILFLTTASLRGLLGYIETRPQVTVYFQTKTTESDISKLRGELLKQQEKVESVNYVSKEDAFQTYKELNKDNPLLLEMVSSDILPASLEIYATRPTYLPELAALLQKKPGIDEVVFQKDIFNKLLTLTNVIRNSSTVMMIFLLVMSVIVLTTTTLFKIALKKDEIELLKYIGASKGYIRKPFMYEGVLFGLTATVSAFIVILTIIFILKPALDRYLANIDNLVINFYGWFALNIWPINFVILACTFIFIAAFGIIIATTATYLATKKYLD